MSFRSRMKGLRLTASSNATRFLAKSILINWRSLLRGLVLVPIFQHSNPVLVDKMMYLLHQYDSEGLSSSGIRATRWTSLQQALRSFLVIRKKAFRCVCTAWPSGSQRRRKGSSSTTNQIALSRVGGRVSDRNNLDEGVNDLRDNTSAVDHQIKSEIPRFA